MLDFCLGPGKIGDRKMLDFVSKAAIDSFKRHVSIQGSNRSLEFKSGLIGSIQYVAMKKEDQLKKNSQFELHICQTYPKYFQHQQILYND